ncbi:MAG: agmatine deiminase family protein [Bryobacteraceae bacterium]|nr:agmatine deiminase family protein [Bryobacteraceae bacterium]
MARMSGPAPAGFRMPAEWAPHEATWLAWPHEKTDWPGKFAPIPWVYAEIVRHLARVERVRILTEDREHAEKARRVLAKAGVELEAVEFLPCPTDRGWLRDSGPLFVKNTQGRVAITNWRFNGWAKYANWRRDNRIPDFAARRLGMPQWKTDVVLEGGSIDVNGQGCLLTTEECLLSPVQARNPSLARDDIEQAFARYLGVTKTLWLSNGIAGDDTHGHVDDIARFVNPTTVVAAVETERSDPNFEPLRENLRLLRQMTDQNGQPLRVATLPMPEPVWFNGQRLPASYANFYVANGVVLMPTFNDPADRIALATLERLMPDRRIVGIYCRDLVLGLGAIHCLTQQEPAAG